MVVWEWVVLVGFLLVTSISTGLDFQQSQSSRRLGPCKICKVVVDSFIAGMNRTAQGHYEGGDAAWVEDNNKLYSVSELRLTEIQEGLCSEVSVGKDHCHEFAVENEDLLEEWWVESGQPHGEGLFTWLCIDKLKFCCPFHHFGPECKPCPGHPGNVCSRHGKCKGDGTRGGNGECSCDTGYAMPICDKCAPLFYESQRDGEPLDCLSCHHACKDGCEGPGAKNCKGCKEGWEYDDDLGCKDVNECLWEDSPCKRSEFCQNIEGSFTCISCDSACDGCFGHGPDMCHKCGNGFTLSDNICIDSTSYERQKRMSAARYLTYSGFAIVSMLLLRRNPRLGSFVGLVFAIYIAMSEYALRS